MLTCLEHVFHVGQLAFVQLPEHLLVQHFGEADDRVQRCPQLVRHVGEKLRLVLARELQLAVDPLQLVAHPVHPLREGADLVPVRDVETPGELSGGDLVEALLRAAKRRHHRPRQQQRERERKHKAAAADTDQEVARACERAVVGGDECVRAGPRLARKRTDIRSEGGGESVGAAKDRFDRAGRPLLVPNDPVEDRDAGRQRPERRRVDRGKTERAGIPAAQAAAQTGVDAELIHVVSDRLVETRAERRRRSWAVDAVVDRPL